MILKAALAPGQKAANPSLPNSKSITNCDGIQAGPLSSKGIGDGLKGGEQFGISFGVDWHIM